MDVKWQLILVFIFTVTACKTTPPETNTQDLVQLTAKPKKVMYKSSLPRGTWAELSFTLIDAENDLLKPADIKLVKESSSAILSLAEDFERSLEKWRYSKNKVKDYENVRFVVTLTPPNKEAAVICNDSNECKLNAYNEKTANRWFNHLNRLNSLMIACNISSGVGYTSFQTQYAISVDKYKDYLSEENPDLTDKKLQKMVNKRKRMALNKSKQMVEQSPESCEQVPNTLKTLKG